jgi:zona occludens toxin
VITLITGLPGNGKTLYALAWTLQQAAKPLTDNGPPRQVFYSGITDVTLPGWTEFDPEKWFELPAGSIVLIDEVQRVMRPRIHGSKVPEFIAKLETHRHLGIDLVLITQHPMLLDSNVRRLTGQHFHTVRKFGTQSANVYEWGQVKENCDKNRTDAAARHSWIFPSKLFASYKSAEVHTHKRRIPMKVWVLFALPLVLAVLVWYSYDRLMNKKKGPIVDAFTGNTVAPGAAGGGVKLTKAAYLEQFVPRIPGLAYTAPVYDEITKPVAAPYPAACVASGGSTLNAAGLDAGEKSPDRCQCYTQQGTRLPVPKDLCTQIAASGFFIPWQQAQAQLPSQQPVKSPVTPGAAAPAVPVATGFYRSSAALQPSSSVLDSTPTESLPPGRGRALPKPS